MTVATRAVHDDRLVSVGLQHCGPGAVVTGEVVSREIERSRDVSLLEEHGRPGIKDERVLAIDGCTEFIESDGCRRHRERWRSDQSRQLGIEALLRCLIDHRKSSRGKAVYHEPGAQGRDCNQRNAAEIAQKLCPET